jgi:hypothetical protein
VSDDLELVSCGIRYVHNIRARVAYRRPMYYLISHTLTLVVLFPLFCSYGDGNFVAQQ